MYIDWKNNPPDWAKCRAYLSEQMEVCEEELAGFLEENPDWIGVIYEALVGTGFVIELGVKADTRTKSRRSDVVQFMKLGNRQVVYPNEKEMGLASEFVTRLAEGENLKVRRATNQREDQYHFKILSYIFKIKDYGPFLPPKQ